MVNYSNNSTPLLPNQPGAIKPILKSSNLSNSLNDNVMTGSLASLNQASSSVFNRRDSVHSQSDSASEKNSTNSSTLSSMRKHQSIGSLNAKGGTAIGLVKLPPIARGSNDFNAVMQDLKKKELY
jgi:hypothetical protein